MSARGNRTSRQAGRRPSPKQPMKLRPYRLSQLTTDAFALVGYSVAGEESVIIAPELDAVFDIGRCPREALSVNHVLLTHGHADHVAGLAYYFAQRDFQGIAGGTALVPSRLVGPLEDLMSAWGRVEGHVPPHRFVPTGDGDDHEIRRGLLARAFATRHCPGSLGFSLIEVRRKLKAEFADRTGPQLVELKNGGVEITNRLEMPLVAYLGDTAKSNYSDLPHVRDARVLLVECTFFEPEHLKRARAGRHLHVVDLPEVLEGMNNERIVIVHVTRRTSVAAARRILRKALPADVLERATFLMSGRHVAPE
ncbi:MAG: MBL fold metallo-hydrolase [Planctomycetota bacterium]